MNFAETNENDKPILDIGEAQPEFVRIEQEGKIVGKVLDVGCRTGDNALYLAQRHYEVVGIDISPSVIEKAMKKAAKSELNVEFLIYDALNLKQLNSSFDTVIDSGVFHIFSDLERRIFVDGLACVIPPGGRFHMLVFSDQEMRSQGIRKVTRKEIETVFTAPRWKIANIDEACYENIPVGCSMAWIATIERL